MSLSGAAMGLFHASSPRMTPDEARAYIFQRIPAELITTMEIAERQASVMLEGATQDGSGPIDQGSGLFVAASLWEVAKFRDGLSRRDRSILRLIDCGEAPNDPITQRVSQLASRDPDFASDMWRILTLLRELIAQQGRGQQ